MNIDFGELEDAVEYASAAEELGGGAFLDTESGSILFDGDGSEDVLPEDLYKNEKYLKIPSKRDFDLGKPLVMKFVDKHLPSDVDMVYAMFRKRGAYSAFKELLYKKGVVDAWYQFEQNALKEAILKWLRANNLKVSKG